MREMENGIADDGGDDVICGKKWVGGPKVVEATAGIGMGLLGLAGVVTLGSAVEYFCKAKAVLGQSSAKK